MVASSTVPGSPTFIQQALAPFQGRATARQAAFGATLAILISYNACLTLVYGLAGSRGNSITTGFLLFALPLALLILSYRKSVRLQAADYIFAGLSAAALISFTVNIQNSEPTREHILLVATLIGYPACRLLSSDAAVVRSAFERITAAIVLAGTIFTAAEIISQWNGPPGKPFVFGFNAAGAYFMAALAFLIIALVTVDRPAPRRTFIISALIFIPTVVFAAAMVRFTFIALAGSMVIAMALTERGKRWHIVVVALTIVTGIIVGQGLRYNSAKIYADFAVERTLKKSGVDNEMPSCNLEVNKRNSIAIRLALVKDAIHVMPTAGLFGTGIDNFMKVTCLEGHQVHITVLQAIVELGWIFGVLFLALIGTALYRLAPVARDNGAARFILCSLVFTVLLSFAHGRISREIALFALLGCAVGVRESLRVQENPNGASTPQPKVWFASA